MSTIKALLVDDSELARELIKAILATDGGIEVVGEAANGLEGVEMVKKLKPDIVTMDIEMPVMDGLAAIEKIMATNAVPILVVTSRGDARTAFAAISKGALDLVVKPDINLEAAKEFISKVKLLSGIRVITHIAGKKLGERSMAVALPPTPMPEYKVDRAEHVIAIASSTGGPDALSVLLSGLPEKCPYPVVIAQHISEGFAPGMVEWLKTLCRVQIRVAASGEQLTPGTVYVSPSEKHMRITDSGTVALVEKKPNDIYSPSCDLLLSSAAKVFGKKAVGVILTGMGSDGVLGMKAIKEAGGATIAQDEQTSVVFGMPKVAIESGVVDKVLPIRDISAELVRVMIAGMGKGTKQRAV